MCCLLVPEGTWINPMSRVSASVTLNHFDVNGDARREREVGQCFNDFWGGVEDIDQALVDAHFKLLACIFVNKGRAVDRILFYFGRERNWARNFCIVAKRGVQNLFHRGVKYLVLVGAHFDAQLLRSNDYCRFARALSGGFSNRLPLPQKRRRELSLFWR